MEETMKLGLKGKTAIVTGGTRGLGKSISMALAAEGVNIVVNYNSRSETAQETVKEIKDKFGVGAVSIKADIASEQGAKDLIAAAD